MTSYFHLATSKCRFQDQQLAFHYFFESIKEPRIHRIWNLMLRAQHYGHTKFINRCLDEVVDHINGFYEEHMEKEEFNSDPLKYYGMSKKDFL